MLSYNVSFCQIHYTVQQYFLFTDQIYKRLKPTQEWVDHKAGQCASLYRSVQTHLHL